ncbi:hypothetical protein AgCh_001048 [Apium graveolens]
MDEANGLFVEMEINDCLPEVLYIVTGLAILWFKSKKKREALENKENDVSMLSYGYKYETGPKKYSYKTFSEATKNFAKSEKVGQGSFESVYKARLVDHGKEIKTTLLAGTTGYMAPEKNMLDDCRAVVHSPLIRSFVLQ